MQFLKPTSGKIILTIILTLPIAIGLYTGGLAEFYLYGFEVLAIPSFFIAYPIFLITEKLWSFFMPFHPQYCVWISIVLYGIYYYIFSCLVVFTFEKILGRISKSRSR